ncbi:MAG TPA: VOC family protein [Miltoncostaeaceae bacterium]|nr:VOC family protein [Miltoncostaeaceae bacterium]
MSVSIDPATRMGPVRLTVADRAGARAFYARALGLSDLGAEGGIARMGPAGGPALVELEARPDAPPRPRRSTGLFHLALLVPDRPELARALRRVIEAGASFTGASDHLVSEALYLDDPEGNGIEIYRDRPREEWEHEGGELRMATLPLDVEGVVGEMPPGPDDGMPDGTSMGHVHLQVRDIPEAEAFWSGVLGFEPTVRGYPGALFVSAGGYHHHVGLNTWGTAGAPPPPEGARGLSRVEVVVPGAAELDRIEGRARAAGAAAERGEEGLRLRDPSGNPVLVRR